MEKKTTCLLIALLNSQVFSLFYVNLNIHISNYWYYWAALIALKRFINNFFRAIFLRAKQFWGIFDKILCWGKFFRLQWARDGIFLKQKNRSKTVPVTIYLNTITEIALQKIANKLCSLCVLFLFINNFRFHNINIVYLC